MCILRHTEHLIIKIRGMDRSTDQEESPFKVTEDFKTAFSLLALLLGVFIQQFVDIVLSDFNPAFLLHMVHVDHSS